jgi:hypothetical protein
VHKPLKILVAAVALWSPYAQADGTQFARVAENSARHPLALQLAVASYIAPGSDVQVDLISAIHIGDKAYYEELNERFKGYDTMLYELIAPKDAVHSERDPESQSIISSTQIAMKDMLALSFQLDEIDYSAANFVHADLSPTELSASMDERGESLYVYFWRLFYASFTEYARDPLGLNSLSLFSAMLSKDSDNAFKVMLAYEMTDLKKHNEILGEDSESAVIGARNQRAIDVLKEQLAGGDKRVAIFYGVAHMPDMEKRLLEQLELEYLDTAWIDAWRLDRRVDVE